jgi:serine/threonine-protein kinase HipA
LYIAKDSLALTLNGTTQWPTAEALRRLGETRGGSSPAKIRQILQRIDEAILETSKEVRSHMKEHPEFAEMGQRLLQEWENGSATSLRS